MRRLWLTLTLLCWAAVGAQAGPNEGGTLVWHLDPTIEYTSDISNYCGLSGVACQWDFDGCDNGYNYEGECQPQIGALNPTGPADATTYVAAVLAAFPEGSCPRVSGVTFGFATYDDTNVFIVNQGACGDFELPTNNWPGQFEGTAVTWSAPIVSQLVEIYWFAAYAYYADRDGSLTLAAHPTQGGKFADDSVPSVLDDIAGFSTLGLNGTPGENVLPEGGPVVGACCFEDGTCQVLNSDECGAAGGNYLGDDTVCDPNSCPQPPATGACCFEDGTCQVLTADECSGAGGAYEGDDTTCDPNPCPQPPAMGACCFPDGTCLVLTQDDCEGTTRHNPPRTNGDLMSRSGVPGEYQGDDTTCDPNPCPQPPATGACCFEDGSCQVLTADECSGAGGAYEGDDTSCNPNPCPQPPGTGACCFEDGSCQVLTADECAAATGSYQGTDTVCEPNPCPQPPATGACCYEDGTCQVLTADDCAAGTGEYQGDDTVCEPNPCPQPPVLGACCFQDGSCQVLNSDECGAAGGDYQGDDTVCDPNPCGIDFGALDISATILGDEATVDVTVEGPSGMFTGQTPLLLEELLPGEYEVMWVKPAHGGCTETYTVNYGETTEATCALVPYAVSVMQFMAEATPNSLDTADLEREVVVKVSGFTGNLDANSIDLGWIYFGDRRVVDADIRTVGVSGLNKGAVEIRVPARVLIDAVGNNGFANQQTSMVDVWTRISSSHDWVRSQLRVTLYRSTAAVASLASSGEFGAAVRPNPARGDMWIEWNSPVSSETELTIYDASGRVLRKLVSESKAAGLHQAQWDGRDATGSNMPSGVYYYRLTLRDTGEQISDKIYLVR